MTVTGAPPGIPGAPRLAGWTGCFMAFGCFTLAVVLEGSYARYVPQQAVDEGFEHEGLAVPTLVARVHQVRDADD